MDYCRQVWLVGEEGGVVAPTDLSLMHLSPSKPQNWLLAHHHHYIIYRVYS